MPVRQNTVYCVNHQDIPMTRSLDFFALTGVNAGKDGIEFQPDRGMPVVMFMCEICGYIENYVAPKTAYWASRSNASGAAEQAKHREFEEMAHSAIIKNASTLGFADVTSRFKLDVGGGEIIEFDLMARGAAGVAIFQVAATDSVRNIQSAAMHVRRLSALYLAKYPGSSPTSFLVVPATSSVGETVMGVRVLKVDEESGAIVSSGSSGVA